MHYSTEWLVLGFIILVLAGITYQAYLAGHLILIAIGVPAALVLAYVGERLSSR